MAFVDAGWWPRYVRSSVGRWSSSQMIIPFWITDEKCLILSLRVDGFICFSVFFSKSKMISFICIDIFCLFRPFFLFYFFPGLERLSRFNALWQTRSTSYSNIAIQPPSLGRRVFLSLAFSREIIPFFRVEGEEKGKKKQPVLERSWTISLNFDSLLLRWESSFLVFVLF